MRDIKLSESAFLRVLSADYTTESKESEPRTEPIAVVLSEDRPPVQIFHKGLLRKPDCGCGGKCGGCGGKAHAEPEGGDFKGVFIALALVAAGFAIAYSISKVV